MSALDALVDAVDSAIRDYRLQKGSEDHAQNLAERGVTIGPQLVGAATDLEQLNVESKIGDKPDDYTIGARRCAQCGELVSHGPHAVDCSQRCPDCALLNGLHRPGCAHLDPLMTGDVPEVSLPTEAIQEEILAVKDRLRNLRQRISLPAPDVDQLIEAEQALTAILRHVP